MPSLPKTSPTCQTNSPQTQIANSSSINAVSFSSAYPTKRFPSPRCASATKIVPPSKSTVETEPQSNRLCEIVADTTVASQVISHQSQGRGAGVGRGLGVGEHLPVHGVGVGVGVDVGVALGVDVGEGVGPCTSKEPMSMRPLTMRSNPSPR